MTANIRPERLLIVADRTCPCPALIDLAHATVRADGEVLVLAPALNSRVRHWVSDTDAAVQGARLRLADALGALSHLGVRVHGEVGDADPLQAMRDALLRFRADAIIVSTHPVASSHWLERNLVDRARGAFAIPVTHLESKYGLAAAVVAAP